MAPEDRYRERGPVSATPEPATEYTTPTVVALDNRHVLPTEAEAWRIKAGISRAECNYYSIYYNPDWDAIVIPFYGMDGLQMGHQLRPLHKRGGAKYINFQKEPDAQLGGILVSTTKSSTLVIVEDLVSAIHINRAGFDALVNYGTHVKPSVLHQIPERYKTVLVWLDNDNPVVDKHSKDMHNILHLYNNNGRCIRRISMCDDPKHYDTEQIKAIVND
jgi:hypothetical protein